MANSKNTQEIKNIEVVVNNFSDSKKYPDYKVLYFKERKMDETFGIEVVKTSYYICLIPDLYFSPFVGKRCRLTLVKCKAGFDVVTNISLVETEEKGGLTI